MIVLDTNVISEIFRPSPERRVPRWLASLTGDVAIASVTLAELLARVRGLPNGKRKDELAKGIDAALDPCRGSRAILPFDDRAAERYADVLMTRESAGAPISMADAQIAGMCLVHDGSCATRNTKDFAHTGVDVVNPWEFDG